MGRKRLYVDKSKIGVVWIPDPKCKKCYGRGYIGKYADTEYLMPCICLKENKDRRIV